MYPDVLSPHYDWSGIFHVRHLGNVGEKRVLDMGCGSGIIGLFAALNGAREVVATDINPSAVENAQENFKKYKLTNARAIESNLFFSVDGTFDLIIFNLPYHGAKANDFLEKAVSDENYDVMKQFLTQAKDYLTFSGEIQVGFSTSGDVDLLREEIAKHGYAINRIYSENNRGYNCQLYVLGVGTSQRAIPLLNAKSAHTELEDGKSTQPTYAQEVVSKLFEKSENKISVVRCFEFGQIIVDSGILVDPPITEHKDFQYAKVPFGIITKGTITVYERNVGVRRLGVGDCVGVFETAHWLNSTSSRKIGGWTLVADGNVRILFLTEQLARDNEEFRDFVLGLARADHVPQPVTDLPLLDWTAAHTTEELLIDTAIVIHSHVLPTNIALIRHLAHLVGIDKIFVLEKTYSTVQSSLNELARAGIDVIEIPFINSAYHDALERSVHVLWRKVAEARASRKFSRLLILDDGGDLWATIPWQNLGNVKISGVEQTQRGIARLRQTDMRLPSIVCVASSGVKKIVESEFIGISIVAKLLESKQLLSGKIGIIGMGNIGQAIFKHLKKQGVDVIAYDSERPDAVSASEFRNSIDALIQDANLIIGATGVDILRGVTLDKVRGSKTFASASSVDIEFQTLIRLASRQGMLGDICVSPHADLDCTILNGGFPVNFDRKREWEPKEDIAITRCLLYVGIMQSARLLELTKTTSGFYALDIPAQKQILARWLTEKGDSWGDFSDTGKIASAIFVENIETMPTVWRE